LELLGVPPGFVPRDHQNDSDALFAANLPAKYLMRRLGSTLSAEEEKIISGIGGLVIASHVAANDFIGFIDGMELCTTKPQTGATPYLIQSKSLLAKIVQEYCGFGKVFVGSFSFVDASANLEYVDRGFGSYTHSNNSLTTIAILSSSPQASSSRAQGSPGCGRFDASSAFAPHMVRTFR
jgi:hypothetical protein